MFAASNAALMLAQLGDYTSALKEMEVMQRKAPTSVDLRAALAAMYWHDGKETKAEAMWDAACSKITIGCGKYKDKDWLVRIRRWPPVMVERLDDFLTLKD